MYYLIENGGSTVRASYKSLTDVAVNGFRVVHVPDSVSIDLKEFDLIEGDNDLASIAPGLINRKWQGLLSTTPPFQFLLGEELEDATSWDLALSTNVGMGDGVSWVGPTTGTANTNEFDITADGVFDTFAVYWEVYSVVRTFDGDRTILKYLPADPETLNVSISNLTGGAYETALHMQSVSMPSLGNRIRVKFENPNPTRYYIGSFAVLY